MTGAAVSEGKKSDFAGLSVASFESRMAFEMESLIRRHGGKPFVAPSMREIPLEANLEAVAFAAKLAAGKVDAVIFMTGVGARTLAEVAARSLPKEDFARALSKVAIVARGPKPVKVLREMGLEPTVAAPEPNTWREVLSALDGNLPVQGKKVFVQEYGVQNPDFIQGLKERGAHVSRVPVYRWGLPEDLAPLKRAIEEAADGRIDILTFTNATQIHHVLRVAAEEGLETSLREAMGKIVVASIGPVVTETLRENRLPVDFEAAKSAIGLFIQELAQKGPGLAREKRADFERKSNPARAQVYPVRAYDPRACESSPFLLACRSQPAPYTPVWIMRQAGRYMKEYRDLRARHSFLELCKNSDLACEVTVTAQERLGVDAAILFSDILVLIEPMGAGLEFTKGEGPYIHRTVRSREDVERLLDFDPKVSLGFVMEAVRKVRSHLKPAVPLIGFAGAPFTLASYMIEGKRSENFLHTKALLYRDPDAWNLLLGKLTEATVRYLNAQIEAGAQAVQVFDSWVGCLAPDDYRASVLPHMKRLFSALAPGVPAIHFGTGTQALLEMMREAGGSVVGLDWRVDLGVARDRLGSVPVQGNLDPLVLLSDPKTIRSKVQSILARNAGRPGHIFNLGHGVLPQTPVENAIALVEAVHELSSKTA